MNEDPRPRPRPEDAARTGPPPAAGLAQAGAGRGRHGLGLSEKLLVLTAVFVMVAEVLIFVPSMAAFRDRWLADKLASARTAALVLEAAPGGLVPPELAQELLRSVGARSIVLKLAGARRLLASAEMPDEVHAHLDLREADLVAGISQAFDTILARQPRFLRVVGNAPMGGDFVEIVLEEAPLQAAMLVHARNILVLSLLISMITAGLVYLALSLMIVRPVLRLSQAMAAFAENPEDHTRIIVPGNRGDEIGTAERDLAAMQRDLRDTLQSKTRLAALGLAVAKINHDLRNLLASAQLLTDRLTSVRDPVVQRFAPRLIHALDRAIAYCQATLAYGGAKEPPPARQIFPLAPLLQDVGDFAGLAPGPDGRAGAIAYRVEVAPTLTVDADPDHLLRILLNLVRNAVQAIEARGPCGGAQPDAVTVRATREGAGVTIEVSDTGPGVSPRSRAQLFAAFQGSTRPGGTGLGLAIAAELTRAHGGDITLIDRSPGATFRIEVPDRPGQASQASPGTTG